MPGSAPISIRSGMRTSSLIVWLSVEAKRGSPSVCVFIGRGRLRALARRGCAGGGERIDGGEEFCASVQADVTEAKCDAEFAESEIRIHEKPAHASGFRRGGLHLGAYAGGVGLEVFVEETGKLFRGGLVGGLVGPRIAGDEDLRRHPGTLGGDLEPEHWIALGLGFRKRAVVDRVDNGTCVFETDAFADAGAAAAPAGVHEPDTRVVLAHLLGEQFGVFAWMPDEERSTEARRERGLRLGDPHFGAGDFRGVAANEVIHRVRGRERANRREHAERVASEENHIGRMAGCARDFRVVDEFDRIRAARVECDPRVRVVHAVVFIEHHVFEYRAEAQRPENIRLALWREVDRLRVAAAFDIEDAVVAPAVLVVADEMALRVGGESGLARAAEAEEQR